MRSKLTHKRSIFCLDLIECRHIFILCAAFVQLYNIDTSPVDTQIKSLPRLISPAVKYR